jgi:hypothetical protein
MMGMMGHDGPWAAPSMTSLKEQPVLLSQLKRTNGSFEPVHK